MQIVKDYPPNFNEIKALFPVKETTIYCFGEVIYNPNGGEIPEDIIYHESIHSEQQREYLTPDLWWQKYLHNRSFRLSQELEAFGKQYQLVKRFFPAVAVKMFLEEASEVLSTMYDLKVTRHQAETMIRKFV